jgi:hypothetical protein
MRHSRSEGSHKSKLPRSRSDRGLACKKRVVSSDGESRTADKEDGYSIKEITETEGIQNDKYLIQFFQV